MTLRILLLTIMALAVLAALLLGGACLAGYLYFLLNQRPPPPLQPEVWWWYWQAYGQIPAQRSRLLIAAGVPCVALIALLVAAIAALLPAARPLYGDARWASRREIGEAGLL